MEKVVGAVTSVSKASSALTTMRRRRAFSWLGGKFGLPTTLVIEYPGTILGTPIISGTSGMAEIMATGIPSPSRILLTVAPQRLQVPQEEVSMTACTLRSFNVSSISMANCSALATGVRLPTVT